MRVVHRSERCNVSGYFIFTFCLLSAGIILVLMKISEERLKQLIIFYVQDTGIFVGSVYLKNCE